MIWPAAVPAGEIIADPIPIDTAAVAEWSAVLDDLQAHLDEPGEALRHWAPPRNLGRLPADLADRARALVAAQSAAVKELTGLRDGVSAEIARLQPVRKNATAIYLDVVA